MQKFNSRLIGICFNKDTVNVSGGNHRHELETEVLRNGKDYGMPPVTSSDINYSKIYTEYSGNLSMSGSFTPQGSISVSSNPTFSGTRSTTENSGSGQSFRIMNPHVVKYCWERIA